MGYWSSNGLGVGIRGAYDRWVPSLGVASVPNEERRATSDEAHSFNHAIILGRRETKFRRKRIVVVLTKPRAPISKVKS